MNGATVDQHSQPLLGLGVRVWLGHGLGRRTRKDSLCHQGAGFLTQHVNTMAEFLDFVQMAILCLLPTATWAELVASDSFSFHARLFQMRITEITLVATPARTPIEKPVS